MFYAFHLNIVKINFNADLKKREMFDLIKFNLIRLTFYILHAYMLTSSEFFFSFLLSSLCSICYQSSSALPPDKLTIPPSRNNNYHRPLLPKLFLNQSLSSLHIINNSIYVDCICYCTNP